LANNGTPGLAGEHCGAAIVVALAIPAHAQWYNRPYAPWRIQPGFHAPPVPDPYIYANQA